MFMFPRKVIFFVLPFSLMALMIASCGDSSNQNTVPIISLPPVDTDTQNQDTPNQDPADPTPEEPAVLNYSYGNSNETYGELRLPQDISSENKAPVIVLIHGGCWLEQYRLTFTQALAESLREAGYATWNIEYRRLGGGGEWPVIFQDTARAIDYVETLAEQHPLDTENVIAIGHSAGGHLALWAAGRNKINPSSELFESNFLNLKGVLAVAPVSDLRSSPCSNALTQLIDGESLSEAELILRLEDTSPIEMLPLGVKTIVMSGDEDTIVPSSYSEAYVLAAQDAGDNSQHIIFEGLDHFQLISPTDLDWPVFLSLIEQLFLD